MTEFMERVAALAEPELEDLRKRRAALIAERQDVDREIAQIEKVARAAGVVQARATTATAKRRTAKPKIRKRISRAKLTAMLAWCREQGEASFTQGQVREAMSFDTATSSEGFTELRERGFIRLAGRNEKRENVYRNIEGSPDTLEETYA